MFLGSTAINKIYLGSTEIKRVYLGSTEVFDSTAGVSWPDTGMESEDWAGGTEDGTWATVNGANGSATPNASGYLSLTVSNLTVTWDSGSESAFYYYQTCSDVDTMRVTMEFVDGFGLPENGNQYLGFLIWSAADNHAHVYLYYDTGSWIVYLTKTVANSTTYGDIDVDVGATFPRWLRFEKDGDDFTIWTSTDGSSFTQRGSAFTFTPAVARVGISGGNTFGQGAYTVRINEFVTADDPL